MFLRNLHFGEHVKTASKVEFRTQTVTSVPIKLKTTCTSNYNSVIHFYHKGDIHCVSVSQKLVVGLHQLMAMALTLSILNGLILSLLETEVNFQQNPYNTSHHTFSMLPHYLAKFRSSSFGISGKMQTKI